MYAESIAVYAGDLELQTWQRVQSRNVLRRLRGDRRGQAFEVLRFVSQYGHVAAIV